MKTIHFLFITLLFLSSCIYTEYCSTYKFSMENTTQDTITIQFAEPLDYGNNIENPNEVILLPGQEKIVRTFIFDNLSRNTIDYKEDVFYNIFRELVFDTYVNEEKLDKELWKYENWTYYEEKPKGNAKYKMIITDNILDNQ